MLFGFTIPPKDRKLCALCHRFVVTNSRCTTGVYSGKCRMSTEVKANIMGIFARTRAVVHQLLAIYLLYLLSSFQVSHRPPLCGQTNHQTNKQTNKREATRTTQNERNSQGQILRPSE